MKTQDSNSVANDSRPPEYEDHRNPRRQLPEREVLRRLWRIYQMALAAADRAADTEHRASD